MGRQKSVPTKKTKDAEFWNMHSNSFIPVIKKRKIQRKFNSKNINILLPKESNKKFYLGNILIGTTNNVFPDEYIKCKIIFNSVDEDEKDTIVVECDGSLIVLVKLNLDVDILKGRIILTIYWLFQCIYILILEICAIKFLALKFRAKDGEVYMDIHFQNLPLPRFYTKLGNCIKTLFQLMYNFETDTANGKLKT